MHIFGSGFAKQFFGESGIGTVSNTDRQSDTSHRITQSPVEDVTRNEILVRHQKIATIRVSQPGCPDIDSSDRAGNFTDTNNIAKPDGPFEKNDQSRNEIGE